VSLVRSRQRLVDHREVFNPGWMVESMLDLVKEETERTDSSFLEPACGSGKPLVHVLRRESVAVERTGGQRSTSDSTRLSLSLTWRIYEIELS
jgi:hypothetical protein